MLCWTDLETTGLRADECDVLEIAAIITTDDFTEVARMERVVYYRRASDIVEQLVRQRSANEISELTGIDPYVISMHDKNGLWRACTHGVALDTVDRDLAEFVRTHGTTTEEYIDEKTGAPKVRTITPQLAGSTISFDRAFIDRHLPRFAGTLHYRNLDVSTLNEMARRCFRGIYDARPNAKQGKENAAHRGMADIEESIAVFKHYRDAFVKAIGAWIHAGDGGTLEQLVRA
jgi:oligoribonuclease